MNKKIYVLIADGFEIIEALATVDVLKRCDADVKMVSISESLEVPSSQNIIVKTDVLLSETDISQGDALILPGGYPGYINLKDSTEVTKIVEKYLDNNKIVAAICGAPIVLSKHKLAMHRKITGHSSIREKVEDTHTYTGENVTVDKNLITGIGAGHSIDFAFAIAKELFSDDVIEKVKIGMELA